MSECAGGNQGLHCVGGNLRFDAPSNFDIPEYKNKLCIPSPRTIKVINNTSGVITFCRTVFPGSEDPQIPIVLNPSESKFLTVMPNCNAKDWSKDYSSCNIPSNAGLVPSMFWTAGDPNKIHGESVGLHYFVTRINEGAIIPVCQWNPIRPSTCMASLGGVDFYPFIVEITGTYNAVINTNNDYTANQWGTYDRTLGNPGFFIRGYADGSLVGSVGYFGPKATDFVIPLSRGQGSSDSKVLPFVSSFGHVYTDPINLQRGLPVNGQNLLVLELYECSQDSDCPTNMPSNCIKGLCVPKGTSNSCPDGMVCNNCQKCSNGNFCPGSQNCGNGNEGKCLIV